MVKRNNLLKNKFLGFLDGGAIVESIKLANDPRAIGKYRNGLTIAKLDDLIYINDIMYNVILRWGARLLRPTIGHVRDTSPWQDNRPKI